MDSKLVKRMLEARESKWVLGRVIRGFVDLVCFIKSVPCQSVPCNKKDDQSAYQPKTLKLSQFFNH